MSWTTLTMMMRHHHFPEADLFLKKACLRKNEQFDILKLWSISQSESVERERMNFTPIWNPTKRPVLVWQALEEKTANC